MLCDWPQAPRTALSRPTADSIPRYAHSPHAPPWPLDRPATPRQCVTFSTTCDFLIFPFSLASKAYLANGRFPDHKSPYYLPSTGKGHDASPFMLVSSDIDVRWSRLCRPRKSRAIPRNRAQSRAAQRGKRCLVQRLDVPTQIRTPTRPRSRGSAVPSTSTSTSTSTDAPPRMRERMCGPEHVRAFGARARALRVM